VKATASSTQIRTRSRQRSTRARTEGDSTSHALILALECDRLTAPPLYLPLANVDEVTIGRGTERAVRHVTEAGVHRIELSVPDGWMSQAHARLRYKSDVWVIEDLNSKNGTLLNGVAEQEAPLVPGDLLELGQTFFLYRESPAEIVDSQSLAPHLTTLVPSLAAELAALADVAPSRVSVVLEGESGTGKEVVARAVHAHSGRAGAFVAVNCGALPDTLVETELFGYKKGAFSGALDDRLGLIRSADKGTLFLDEIGDLPLPSQAAFLRVLQESEVHPVGATRPVKVDLRLIAATHRDLGALVEKGEFRKDLFARISGFTLALPPLRQRREDLGLLFGHLLGRIAGERADSIELSCDAARALFSYSWPLNIRELEKALGTALVLAKKGKIDVKHLPPPLRNLAPVQTDRRVVRKTSSADDARRAELVTLLREHKGNVSAVARAMGKGRMQIHRWMERYRLVPEKFRT
jgi:DNA-binding NtrC family response regulator